MHTRLTSRLLAATVVLLSAVACGSSESSSKPTASAQPAKSSGTPSGTASVAAPSAQPTAQPEPRAALDTWLLVGKTEDLAIIEVRAGKAPVVELEQDSDESKALQKKVSELVASGGIRLEMHEPGPGGKGRGALVSKLMKPGDPSYATALRMALEEAGYRAKEIPALDDTAPASIKQLDISRDGEKVGSIDFRKTPPVVTVHSTKSEGSGLTRDWEDIQKLEKLVVRFHGPKAGVETLFKVEAKPGTPDYPNAVRLHLIVNRYYDAQRKYKLDAVP
jgi:hypothetical protein